MKAIMFLITILILGLVISGQTVAPTPVAKLKFTEAQSKVMGNLMLAKIGMSICELSPSSVDCTKEDYSKMYGEAMAKAVSDSVIVQHLLAEAVQPYEGSRGLTKSAMQVSQIADQQNVELMRIIVAQNQRIIELLDLLVKKK